MPNPNTNFKLSDGRDLGSVGITKEYLMTVYPQIANQLITPELWVWGDGSNGALGNNTTTNRCTPVTSSAGGANWKQVSVGGACIAAIKTDGTLWTWGRNYNGQLGINDAGSGNTRCTPVTTFVGGTNWKQVACSNSNHTAAIKTDGTLWTWGRNYRGSLGVGDENPRCTPVQTSSGGFNWKQVACGSNYTAAIKTDGTLWTWGRGTEGQLGNNVPAHSNIPVQVFGSATNWKQVACGGYHTSAIKTDGTLWGWGRNDVGNLGINDITSTDKQTPVTTFVGGTNWKQVYCGSYLTAAIKTDGTLWTWGSNTSGQLGTNDVAQRNTPVTTFAGGTNWKQVAGGFYSTMAIKTDGTLWVWGYNSSLNLGNNTTTNRFTPVTTFAGGTNWKQVAGSSTNTAAIKTSDDLIGI